MQPSVEGQVDGSIIPQVLEVCDNNGDMASGSTPAAEGPTSELPYEETREDLAWSKIPPEDRTAVLWELVSLCQQAVHRYCNEHDLFRLSYPGYIFGCPGVDGIESIRGIIPTTFSLMHWVNKLMFICEYLPSQAKLAGLQHFTFEILPHAKDLTRAAESDNQLDRSQALKCVESAKIICTHLNGWTFSRRVGIIQVAIEHGQIESLGCIRRDEGATKAGSRKRRRQSSE